ncbi:MAG: amidohydrolase [Phycisphaeraceae bacterium]|nr:amidohydrolase [Phycisphaeraceae bacterium]
MQPPQDILFIGGHFFDPLLHKADQLALLQPIGQAMLVREGRIAAVGDEATVKASSANHNTTTIDLHGLSVIPGLVDSHCHLDGVGFASLALDLFNTTSKEQCLKKIRLAAADRDPDHWIVGMGFNVNAWPPQDQQSLTLADIDSASPLVPVLLAQFDGHSCWANSATLRASGIDPSSASPPADPTGGRFGRDASGKINGFLYENALSLLRPPTPTDAQRLLSLRLGMEIYARHGYTTVHAMGSGNHDSIVALLDRAEQLQSAGPPTLRIRGYPLHEHFDAALDHRRRRGRDPFLHVAGIKTFFDGSLNSHTAWMLKPYDGEGDNTGMTVISPQELRRQLAQSNAAGLPLACHAIGDRAVRELLDAIESVGSADLTNRVEHAQHLDPADLPRFAATGTVVSMQTCHLIPDWPTADRILGPRALWTYAAASLVNAGATVILGSDAPVVPCDPRDSFTSAVFRADRHGQPPGGWNPKQALTAAQWLWMHTTGPAAATGEQHQRGRLQLGMDADLTFLKGNPFTAEVDKLSPFTVAATMLAGQFTHREF